jgi:hypothetical protein
MATIYIFYGSLLGMCGMLSVKVYELKRRRRSLIYRMFARFDERTHGMLARVIGTTRVKVKELEELIKVDFKKHIYQSVVTSIAHLRGSYDKMRQSARGVQKLKANPKVSAFLRDIEEAKREISSQGGEVKIEEVFITSVNSETNKAE